jgi:peroxin-13
MGMSSYGGYGSSYGSYGGMNSYSPYNRFGGGMGMGMGGMGGPEDFSLTQRMEAGTRATFDVIQSIVGAFGGFAQMLDSTYMATHSSFMAMVGVAEQFGHLKHYLGGIFSIFALIRWIKRIMYRLTGRTPPPELYGPVEENKSTEESTDQAENEPLQITENGESTEQQPQQQQVARVSRKRPVIIFLALVTGLPYLIYKLIQRSHEYRARQQRMMIPQYSGAPPEMARVVHDFVAENPIELTIRKGEIISVLSKVDPATGEPCDWWQGRTANGVIGIFPANYVQIENPGY